MIMRHQLHLHESRGTITPMMTHQPGAATRAGIDLHLGKSLSLGGGTPMIHSSTYHILSVLCISMFRLLYCSCSYFLLSKTQKDQKYFRCFSLFAFLVCYLWFALLPIFGLLFEKSKNILLCLLFPSFLFQKSKTQKYLLFFICFVKFVVGFSLSLLHWNLVFTLYYSSHTSEEQ
jgi:hypothetical protein